MYKQISESGIEGQIESRFRSEGAEISGAQTASNAKAWKKMRTGRKYVSSWTYRWIEKKWKDLLLQTLSWRCIFGVWVGAAGGGGRWRGGQQHLTTRQFIVFKWVSRGSPKMAISSQSVGMWKRPKYIGAWKLLMALPLFFLFTSPII
jgi:hypothetical protein